MRTPAGSPRSGARAAARRAACARREHAAAVAVVIAVALAEHLAQPQPERLAQPEPDPKTYPNPVAEALCHPDLRSRISPRQRRQPHLVLQGIRWQHDMFNHAELVEQLEEFSGRRLRREND